MSGPVKKDIGVGQVETRHCQFKSKRIQELEKLKPVIVRSFQNGYRSEKLETCQYNMLKERIHE